MEKLKKLMMLLVWRFQQINAMYIIIGLSFTLTLQVYPLIGWRLDNLGIPPEWDWLKIIIIFLIILSGALLIGVIYDTIFKLWIQQQVVLQEHNPYAKGKLNPKLMINMKYYWIPIVKKLGLENEGEFASKWTALNLHEDPIARKEVELISAWIHEYKLKPEDKRWLKDLEKILKKPYSPGNKAAMKK